MRARSARWVRVAAAAVTLVVIVAACGATTPSAGDSGGPAASGAGASVAAPSGKAWRIAMASPLNHALFEQERRGAQLAADLVGAKLEFTTMGDDFTMENYINFIGPIIATKPDAIAFGFYDDGFAPLMDEASKAGVLVVFVNGTPRNNPNTKFPQYQFVGSSGPSEVDQAATLAFSFVQRIGKPGKIAVINNFPGSPDHQLRIDGGTAVFEKNGYTTEVLAGSMDDATALANVSAFLSANPDVVGVFTTGSTSAIAACQFMGQNNLSIPVSTFDATADTIKLVKDGCVTDLIDQQFFLEGFYAVMNAWTALERGVIPVHTNTGTYLITKDNVDSYKEQ